MPRSRNRVRAEAFEKIETVRRRLLLAVPFDHPRQRGLTGGPPIALNARDLLEWEKALTEALAVLADPRATKDP